MSRIAAPALAMGLALVGCGDDDRASRDADSPDASFLDADSFDAAAGDAGFDAGRSGPSYCPAVRPTPDPGRCTSAGDAGTAMDGGTPTVAIDVAVTIGRILLRPGDETLDARGRLVVVIYDEDPYLCERCDERRVVVDGDDVALDPTTPYVVSASVPAGPLWIFAWLDDDGDHTSGGPMLLDVPDIVTTVPQVGLACAPTTIPIKLDRRLVSLRGMLSVSPDVMTTGTRGDVWLIVYPGGPITPVMNPIGGSVLRDVDLTSPSPYEIASAIDYDGDPSELIHAPAAMQLIGVFDADADGKVESGDLLATQAPGSTAGIGLCLDDTGLEFEHDVVFNVVID